MAKQKLVPRNGCITKELKQAIQSAKFSATYKNKAIKLLHLMLQEIHQDGLSYLDYIDKPSSWLRKAIGGDYSKILSALKDLHIIQPRPNMNDKGEFVAESYSTQFGQSKSYRITHSFLSSNWDSATYMDTQYEVDEDIIIGNECWDRNVVIDDIKDLVISRYDLVNEMNKVAQAITSSDFIMNDAIEDKFIPKVFNRITGYVGHSTKEICLAEAKRLKTDFIKDGDRFIIGDVADYVDEKKRNMIINYTRSIHKLCSGKLYVNRNQTNNRLDHNLTSISKKLLKVIKEKNDLVEIDLANSQFALLAHMMQQDEGFNMTDDFDLFKTQVEAGTLYQFMADRLSIDKASAKTMMMELAFSSHMNRTANKRELKSIFPSIVAYADKIKKDEGSNQFAILLQKYEARMFVDNLYSHLKKNGFFAITKHDSLIVKKQDVQEIMEIINEYCQNIGFKGVFKADCPLMTIVSKTEFKPKNEEIMEKINQFIVDNELTAEEQEKYEYYMNVFKEQMIEIAQNNFKQMLDYERKKQKLQRVYMKKVV